MTVVLIRPPVGRLSRITLRAHEVEFRRPRVEQRAKLVHVPISIAVERDEGREVQRRAGNLRRKGPFCVEKVVVAVDQKARISIGDQPAQFLHRDVGETEMQRAADMKLVVFLAAAGIEHDRTRIVAHPDEVILRYTPALAMNCGLSGHSKVAGHVDGGIVDRLCRKRRNREQHGDDGDQTHTKPSTDETARARDGLLEPHISKKISTGTATALVQPVRARHASCTDSWMACCGCLLKTDEKLTTLLVDFR